MKLEFRRRLDWFMRPIAATLTVRDLATDFVLFAKPRLLYTFASYINYVTQRSSDVSWCHRSANKPQVMRQRLFQHKIQQPSFVVAPTILLIIFNRGE